MAIVYVVANTEEVVKQAILNLSSVVAVESLGDAMHKQDSMPESEIFIVEIRRTLKARR